MKRLLIIATVLSAGFADMQANKVKTTGNETPEEMAALVSKYGVQNQPGYERGAHAVRRSPDSIVRK